MILFPVSYYVLLLYASLLVVMFLPEISAQKGNDFTRLGV